MRDRLEQLAELDKRRESILSSLEELGLLDHDLRRRVRDAPSRAVFEDVYLPFRPKRRTRATMARERGLELLARAFLAQSGRRINVSDFVNPEQDAQDEEAALAGARDILAEEISEDATARSDLRRLFLEKSLLRSTVVKKKEAEAAKFRDYFAWTEPLARAPSHRILALLRGNNEGFLRVQARTDATEALGRLERRYLRGGGFASEQVRLAIEEAYRRLLLPSLEREALKDAKARADEQAIAIFATNLRELLIAPPFSSRGVLAIDPGFRTGCNVVALDARGGLLSNTTIFPTQGKHQQAAAARTLQELMERFAPQAIAIGNGTAGRETDALVRDLKVDSPVIMVDESGSSIYSASEVARGYRKGRIPKRARALFSAVHTGEGETPSRKEIILRGSQ